MTIPILGQAPRTLKHLEAMDFKQAIYSHTHAKEPVGSKKDVTLTLEFINDLQAGIIAEFKKGTSFYQMSTTLKLPKYEHWDFFNEWLPINVWKMMFHMEMGPFPWKPEQ